MLRFDCNRKFVYTSIIKNNRLNAYERYIYYAKKNKYKICTMLDFYNDFLNKNQDKHFVLRHDVDHNGSCTRKMFERELKLGVKSTYYFRFSTIDMELIKEMKNENFEVGLHYESVADYAIQNGIDNSEDLDWVQIEIQIKNDIKKFQDIVGFPITSICSHGAPQNVSLGVSNNYIFEKQPYQPFGIIFEAYDKELYAQYINCHIMDCTLREYYGFYYKDNPIDAINSNFKNIVFLAHPSHWYFSQKEKWLNLGLLLFGKGNWNDSKHQFCRVQGRDRYA